MNAGTLANSLCKDLVESVERWGGDTYIVTRFQYPDGDFVSLYVDDGAVSDRGTTIHKLRTSGLEMTEHRQDTVRAMCAFYGVRVEDDVFSLQLGDNPNIAAMRLCEAAVRVSGLRYEHKIRHGHILGEQIGELLQERVAAHKSVIHNWVSRSLDTKRAFPVDFRVTDKSKPRHIFHVSNAQKADKVSAVINFLAVRGVDVPSLTIVSKHARLPRQHQNRIQTVSSEVRFNGVEGNEKFIVDFALA